MSAERVTASRTARRVARGALGWGLLFGVSVASSALGFAAAYKTTASRRLLAASLRGNAGLQALFGQPRHIDTVAGFTEWRSLAVIVIIGAIWAILASTAALRGEEDNGRWEILLAGDTTRGRATGAAAAGLSAALVGMWVVTSLVVVAVGRDHDANFGVGASLMMATTGVASAALFMAVGAVTSQLAPARRSAATLAAAIFGALFLVRVVADTTASLGWLRWATPLGWIESVHPLTDPRPLPLVGVALLTAALFATSVLLAGRRDLGASIVRDRDTAEARTRLLGGPLGLAVRLGVGTAVAWLVGIGASSLLFGLIAKSAAEATRASSGFEDALARLGATGSGAATYLGLIFVVLAAGVAMLAAGQVGTTRQEEALGRCDNILVRPVGRARWLTTRVLVATGIVVVVSVGAGAAGWAGAAMAHSDVGFGSMLRAGLNLIPASLFVLGVGTLAHGIDPRRATAVAYGIVAWSFLIETIGVAVSADHWVLDTSLFTHVAPVPAVGIDWTSALVMVALGALAAVVGTVAFSRRDLVSA